jgi:Fe-S-cluster containining protein
MEYDLCKTCNGNCCRIYLRFRWKEDAPEDIKCIKDFSMLRNRSYQEIKKWAQEVYYRQAPDSCGHLVNGRCAIYKDRDTFCKTYFCEGLLYLPI